MARADRLRSLYIAREHLSDAHGALLGGNPTVEMRRMARTVATLFDKVEVQINAEQERLEQVEADEPINAAWREGRVLHDQTEGTQF